MFAAIRFKHWVIVGAQLLGVMFFTPTGYAQLPPPPPTPRGCPVGGCGSDSTSSGGGGNAIGEIIGLPGDIVRAHKKAKEAREAKKLTELNDQGIAAYDKKDWAAAEVEFKKALQLTRPTLFTFRNLAMAQGHEGEDAYLKGDYTTAFNYFQQALTNDPADDPDKQTLEGDLAATQRKIDDIRRDQEQHQQNRIAASEMQQSIQNFAQSLSAVPPSNTAIPSGRLDFNDGKSGNNSNKPSELAFMDSDHDAVADSKSATGSTQPSQGASACPFNTTCNPANPTWAARRPRLPPLIPVPAPSIKRLWLQDGQAREPNQWRFGRLRGSKTSVRHAWRNCRANAGCGRQPGFCSRTGQNQEHARIQGNGCRKGETAKPDEQTGFAAYGYPR